MSHSILRSLMLLVLLVGGIISASCGGGGAEATPSPSPIPSLPVPPQVARTFAYVSSAKGIAIYEVGNDGAMARVVGEPVGELAVTSVVVHPSGRFAYAVNYFDDAVSAYRIDAATGMLEFINSAATESLPYNMKIHPTGRFGYVTNLGSDSISIFAINADTGALQASSRLQAGSGLTDIAVHPSGKHIYVESDDLVSAYSIDVDDPTGTLVFVNSVAVDGHLRLAIAPSGNYLYVLDGVADKLSVHPIDTTSGAIGLARDVMPVGKDLDSIVVDPAGRFAYVQHFPDEVSAYTIEPDGSLHLAGTVSTEPGPSFLTPDPTGHLVYMIHFNHFALAAYMVDQKTGALAISSLPTVWLGSRAWDITLASFQP